jgi:hypothetical protein
MKIEFYDEIINDEYYQLTNDNGYVLKDGEKFTLKIIEMDDIGVDDLYRVCINGDIAIFRELLHPKGIEVCFTRTSEEVCPLFIIYEYDM